MSNSQILRFKRMPTPNKGVPMPPERKLKISQAKLGKPRNLTPDQRAKFVKNLSAAKTGNPRPEHIQKMLAEYSRARMSDPVLKEEICRKALSGLRKRPTSLEQKFINLCEKYNLPFRYVGDGQIWINGKNPDFINTNGKKELVEVLGKYWHNIDETQDRITHYSKYGFKCIPVWEDDFLEDEKVLDAIRGSI